jgi:hypothetical protein
MDLHLFDVDFDEDYISIAFDILGQHVYDIIRPRERKVGDTVKLSPPKTERKYVIGIAMSFLDIVQTRTIFNDRQGLTGVKEYKKYLSNTLDYYTSYRKNK